MHQQNLTALNEACRTLESYFARPAFARPTLVRETEYAWRIWLQTLPITWERLLNAPFDRRQLYLTGEAPGLMPLVCTHPGDKQGFELIAEEGGAPIHLDLFKSHKNLGIFANTRAGKSVLVLGIITQALAHGMPVVALDFPEADGSSTLADYTHFVNGAYFDISKQSNNLFELPDLRHLAVAERQFRLEEYQSFLKSTLLTMIVGDSEDKLLSQTVRLLIVLALKAFFADPDIQQRYDAASAGGFGTAAWQGTPTLADFLPFCTGEHLDLSRLEGDICQGLERVSLRLRFWLTSRMGRAIAAPSSFPTDAQLLVFSQNRIAWLTQDRFASGDTTAVLLLSAYSAALRRALASPTSVFCIDAPSSVFKFATIANLVGRLCANGAKAGVRVILSGQDPDTIARSAASAKIFQNLSTRLIGRIGPMAVNNFVNILKYPRSIIWRNATESFFPKRECLYSQWLLDDNGNYSFCQYYPSKAQMAIAGVPERVECPKNQILNHQ